MIADINNNIYCDSYKTYIFVERDHFITAPVAWDVYVLIDTLYCTVYLLNNVGI